MTLAYIDSVKICKKELDEYIEDFNGHGKKALIVTGKSSAKNGALDDVKRILLKLKIEYSVFCGVIQNPPIENVCECASFALEHEVDFLIAIGGGSAIDVAKAASVLIANKTASDVLPLFNDEATVHIPILAIPTTAGTGSESTGSAILTCKKQQTKISIKCRVYCTKAFINFKYTRKR